MYEELIKQMRFCAEDHSVVECQDKCPNFGNFRPSEYCFSKLLAKAADAIEELQRKMQTQIELTKFFRDKTFELENRFEDYRMKSRARGKWELFKCRDAWRHYQCSVCGKIVHNDIFDKTDCRSNYCPNCGANMEVDGE